MLKRFARLEDCRKWLLAVALLAVIAKTSPAQADQTVYTDSLQNGWENWGWTSIDYNNTSTVHSGAKSVSVTFTNNTYQAIYLHHAAFNSSMFTNLTFWIHGGSTGGQQVQVRAILGSTEQAGFFLPALAANTWQQFTLSLASLGAANQPNVTGFWIQDRIGAVQPTFYVDDITLVSTNSTLDTNPPVITVNALLNQHPISAMIYGVAFASSNQLAELNAPLNRSGGNAETRYNWQINAHNRGADWFFESIPDSTNEVAGLEADKFVTATKAGGAEPLLTVPMIGWVPKVTPGRSYLASYTITKYGPQTAHDTSYSAWYDFGNGISVTNNTPITWNDPNDANFATNSTFQQEWIKHLTNTWGLSTNGGVRYYCMDNEHTIWHSTHRDVHHTGTTMQEIRDKLFDYGAKVKAVDPDAFLLAPEEWGWTGYFYSGFDSQWAGTNNWNPANLPDRNANAGWDYMPWLLDQARQYETNTGQRLLDVFTLHFYPQGGEFNDDNSASTQLLRNRSTRALWDTNYVDETWINSVVKLIPRMKEWVAAYYPGTKIGITEYNWGGETNINGATAQADIYGIFGREGLDYGTRWTTPASDSPTFKAMKMYRNYDGNKSTFGDTSISASGPNPDNFSCFAALRSADGAMTIMAINKQPDTNAPMNFALTNFLHGGTAHVWQLTSNNIINQLSAINFSGNTFSNTLPRQSITLFVIPGGTPPSLRSGGASNNTFTIWLDGQAGQRYALHSSSDFLNWFPLQTNTLVSNSIPIVVPAANEYRFYRAQWLP